jgi:hypothetical protein
MSAAKTLAAKKGLAAGVSKKEVSAAYRQRCAHSRNNWSLFFFLF